jgi:hypothetical protein
VRLPLGTRCRTARSLTAAPSTPLCAPAVTATHVPSARSASLRDASPERAPIRGTGGCRDLFVPEQKANGFKDTKISRHETRSTVIMDVFTRFPCQVRTHQSHRGAGCTRRASPAIGSTRVLCAAICAPDGHVPFNVRQPTVALMFGTAATYRNGLCCR